MEFALSGRKFFPSRVVSILKRDEIVENHCLIQYSPFDVRNVFSVLATPLVHNIDFGILHYCSRIPRGTRSQNFAFRLHRGPHMSTHFLLNLLNELGQRDKMRGLHLQ